MGLPIRLFLKLLSHRTLSFFKLEVAEPPRLLTQDLSPNQKRPTTNVSAGIDSITGTKDTAVTTYLPGQSVYTLSTCHIVLAHANPKKVCALHCFV